jgi:hypothetical protein
MLSRINTLHILYLKKFYNKKLVGIGAVIGAWCGATYCVEYYSKKTWNKIVDSIETEIEIQTRNEISKCELKQYKYKNVFSLVIIPNAPCEVNMFTTMSTGSVLGYIGMVYFPVTITGVIVYNLATYENDD